MIEIDTKFLGTIHIRLVSTYKHLGTMFSVGGRMNAEIRHRLGYARCEFRRYRKQVYSNGGLQPARRIAIFNSLIMSGLLFDIGVWPSLLPQELQQFTTGLNGLYHSLALAIWGDNAMQWRAERTRAKLQLSSAEVLLKVARLRHLQHLCLKADKYMWAFVHLDGSWLSMAHDDLKWLQHQIPRRLPQVDPEEDWTPWRLDMDYGRRWKRNIRMAQLHHDLQDTKHSDWQEWHRSVLYLFRDEGLWRDEVTKEHNQMNACLRCQQCFRTDQAWSVHAFKVHGRVTPARRFAEGTVCSVCLRHFSLHSRLVNHLRHSKSCRDQLRKTGQTTVPQPSKGSKVDTKEMITRREIPVITTYGPMAEAPAQDDRPLDIDLTKHEFEFAEDMLDFMERQQTDPMSIDEGVTVVWQLFQRSVIRARDLKLLVMHYMDHLDEAEDDERALKTYLDKLLDAVAQVWNGKWLMGHLHGFEKTQAIGTGTLRADEEIEALLRTECRSTRIPIPLQSKHLLFLHLFSGHRRIGDVQEAVEQVAQSRGLQVQALSVDVVISLKYGDLLRDDTLQTFLAAIRSGWISGTIAGPPCETWSTAREQQLEGGGGPRPVRSDEYLLGLPQLSVKEIRQVLVGNRLLRVAVLFMTASWMYGVFAALEHPAEPKNPRSASIWRLAILRLLMAQPQIVRVTVLQGLYGAKSTKPTDLLLVHPPLEYKRILVDNRSTDSLPKTHSIGLNSDGTFQTTELKSYPPALCRALADLWCHATFERPPVVNETEFPEEIRTLVAELHSTIGMGTLGPDFCPKGVFSAV